MHTSHGTWIRVNQKILFIYSSLDHPIGCRCSRNTCQLVSSVDKKINFTANRGVFRDPVHGKEKQMWVFYSTCNDLHLEKVHEDDEPLPES